MLSYVDRGPDWLSWHTSGTQEHRMAKQHSRQRCNELIQLIVDYHQLKEFYEKSLKECPGPVPDTLPEDSDTEGWRARYNVLAIRKPFYNPFLTTLGKVAPGQRHAMKFRTQFTEITRRVDDYCGVHKRAGLRRALRPTDVTHVEGDGIADGLQRHIDQLKAELLKIDEAALLDLRLEIELHLVLREARKVSGQTQDSASGQLQVSLASFKGWESGKHSPKGGNRQAVRNYIRSALTQALP
jgi:DNA-binding transcriptional regulator YiaG